MNAAEFRHMVEDMIRTMPCSCCHNNEKHMGLIMRCIERVPADWRPVFNVKEVRSLVEATHNFDNWYDIDEHRDIRKWYHPEFMAALGITKPPSWDDFK